MNEIMINGSQNAHKQQQQKKIHHTINLVKKNFFLNDLQKQKWMDG